MENETRYDAFISYRHCDLDKYVAEILHEQLESYKLPKNIKRIISGGRTKINRVFRDKDELPLTSNLEDPIIKALANSEFLIVICSPRLKESAWCRKEIETFISMHGRKNVLAVLIEGEPADSFPDELLYDYIPVQGPNDSVQYVKKTIEPLAADFRGNTKRNIKKAMKEEILRLLAPMFNVNYDDLKQRHRERRTKHFIGVATGIACLSVLFGGYFALSAIKIKNQNNKILDQAASLEEQADILEAQNEALKKEQALSLVREAKSLLQVDNRNEAILKAYQALTEQNGISFPYTAEAQNTLTSALLAYECGNKLEPAYQITTAGLIVDICISPNRKYALVIDSLNNLTLCDVPERNIIKTIESKNDNDSFLYVMPSSYGFLTNSSFFYLSSDDIIHIIDINTLEERIYTTPSDSDSTIYFAACSSDGKKIYTRTPEGIYVVDSFTLTNDLFLPSECFISHQAIYTSNEPNEFYIINSDDNFNIIDSNNGDVLFSTDEIVGNIVKCISYNDILYVASYSNDITYNIRSYITAIDKTSKSIIWQKEEIGYSIDNISQSVSAGRDCLLCILGNLILLLDAQTGELNVSNTSSSDILLFNILENGDFDLYNSTGYRSIISSDVEKVLVEFPYMHCTKLSKLAFSDGCFLGVPENSNRVVFYTYCMNSLAKIYEDNISESEQYGYDEYDSISWANECDLPKAMYIESYLELDEIGKTIVTYKDNTMEVYQSDSMELLHTYNLEYTILNYLGLINEYYIFKDSNRNMGFFLNESGEICAEIPNLIGLNEEMDSLVISGHDFNAKPCNYTLHVYSLEDLLTKSEEYLGLN